MSSLSLHRRRFLEQMSLAAGALLGTGAGNLGRLAAQQKLSQQDILRFEPTGNVTLIHVADIHAQLVPTYFREPSINLGVGEARGRFPTLPVRISSSISIFRRTRRWRMR